MRCKIAYYSFPPSHLQLDLPPLFPKHPARIPGTIQLDQGNYLGSSSLAIHGIRDLAIVEAIASADDLLLQNFIVASDTNQVVEDTDDLLLQNFIVDSDSNQVVEDIQKGTQGVYGSVISDIKLHATSFSCNFIF